MARSQKSAKDYALTLLSQRAYTEKGLYDKLVRRYDEQESAAAVARMIELNLLDDLDYARRYASDIINLKGMSLRRAAVELGRKGISRDTAEEALSEFGDDPKPAIARVIKRRHTGKLDDEKGRNKAINSLLRLGYRYGDILTVMRNLEDDEDYYEI